jgi:hypothetical protein
MPDAVDHHTKEVVQKKYGANTCAHWLHACLHIYIFMRTEAQSDT